MAWPKDVTEDSVQMQEDGSVCVTSKDEFGSLILSPHRRDFTVCYLAALSKEKRKERKHNSQTNQNRHSDKASNSSVNRKQKGSDFGSDPAREKGNLVKLKAERDVSRELKTQRSLTPENKPQVHSFSQDGLNLSPITQASYAESPQALSNGSGSPITPENAHTDRNAKFRQFSTPTEGLEDNGVVDVQVCSLCGKLKNNISEKNFLPHINAEGSFLGEHFGRELENQKGMDEGFGGINFENRCSCTRKDVDAEVQLTDGNNYAKEMVQTVEQEPELRDLVSPRKEDYLEDTRISSSSREGASETRCRYTWLTRHISCDECPTAWSHVVKLAQAFADGLGKSSKDSNGNSLKVDNGEEMIGVLILALLTLFAQYYARSDQICINKITALKIVVFLAWSKQLSILF